MTVEIATLSKVALALFALPATCMTLCTFRVEPLHDWMMRHRCPFAMLAMHQPSHPIGVPLRAKSTQDADERPTDPRGNYQLPSASFFAHAGAGAGLRLPGPVFR